ncbi:MAG: hypothetical protein M3362_02640 [Acidobacteriota bacterium]|nr:hypothetical protein [Acidobacteriota bacterium]
MKRNLWAILLLTLTLLVTNVSAQNRRLDVAGEPESSIGSQPSAFEVAIRKVRRLESISYRIGFALAPGEFYKLSQECLKYGAADSFRALLKDESPVVRVLGLICLAKSLNAEEFAEAARPVFTDDAQVRYTNGCVLNQRATVGQIARRLAEGSFFLADENGGVAK